MPYSLYLKDRRLNHRRSSDAPLASTTDKVIIKWRPHLTLNPTVCFFRPVANKHLRVGIPMKLLPRPERNGPQVTDRSGAMPYFNVADRVFARTNAVAKVPHMISTDFQMLSP